MKISDGQLDHANKQIETLRKTVAFLENLCADRFDLLKRVIECRLDIDSHGRCVVRLEPDLYVAIHEATDEHEVNP